MGTWVAPDVVRMELAVRSASHRVGMQEPGPHDHHNVARQTQEGGHEQTDADHRFVHRTFPSFALKEQQREVNANWNRVESDSEEAEDGGGVVEAARRGLGVEAVAEETEGRDGLVCGCDEGR